MEDQSLELSRPIQPGQIPTKWQERFLIKRIDEEDIEISLDERNKILKALNVGDRFIQIGKYTLMLNSIKSIDPRYEPDNIPPRPKEKRSFTGVSDSGSAQYEIVNQEEIDEWEKWFGEKKREGKIMLSKLLTNSS